MTSTKQVVLITGASSGFGRLMAEDFARHNYRVFAAMRNTNGKNAGVAQELGELARRESLDLQVVELDVAAPESAERCVSEVIQSAGKIDVLVNNAGIGFVGLTESYTDEQAHRIFETNFFGVFRLVRAVLPHMLKRHRGLLVQVSSGAGRIVLPGMGLYCASKFALEALSEALRYELGSSGVDSVSVQPGAYPTGIQSKLEVGEDAGRNAAYGAAQEMPGIVDALIKKSTANPQDVAEAVRKIIETPAGTREAHYRIGKGASGVEILNEAAAKVQSELLQIFGVAELAKFRSGEAATA